MIAEYNNIHEEYSSLKKEVTESEKEKSKEKSKEPIFAYKIDTDLINTIKNNDQIKIYNQKLKNIFKEIYNATDKTYSSSLKNNKSFKELLIDIQTSLENYKEYKTPIFYYSHWKNRLVHEDKALKSKAIQIFNNSTAVFVLILNQIFSYHGTPNILNIKNIINDSDNNIDGELENDIFEHVIEWLEEIYETENKNDINWIINMNNISQEVKDIYNTTGEKNIETTYKIYFKKLNQLYPNQSESESESKEKGNSQKKHLKEHNTNRKKILISYITTCIIVLVLYCLDSKYKNSLIYNTMYSKLKALFKFEKIKPQ